MAAISVLAGYLLGSVPFGYLLVRLRRGADVRTVGSGSTGATNVTRSAGPLAGLLVLALDLGKGYLAVWLAIQLAGANTPWPAAAGLVAILGHSFPVFLQFRGGKSVATGMGVFLYFTPLAVAAVLGVWLVVLILWRYISLASVIASTSYPLLAFQLYHPALPVMLAAGLGAGVIILRHHANLARIAAGTESKFSLRRKS